MLDGVAGSNLHESANICKELLQHIVTEISKKGEVQKEMVFMPHK